MAEIDLAYRQSGIVPWIVGLALLALVIGGLALALRPRDEAFGEDDGASAVGHVQKQRPRTLRQMATLVSPGGPSDLTSRRTSRAA